MAEIRAGVAALQQRTRDQMGVTPEAEGKHDKLFVNPREGIQ